MPQIVYILLAAAVLAGVGIGGYALWRTLEYRKGRLADRKVDQALKKFGVIRNYKVLRDIPLDSGKHQTVAAHLLIGFFGILLVRTANDTAEYYGDVKGPAWTKVKDGRKTKMENLVERNLSDMTLIREIFSKQKVYNIKMEGIVVFCGNPKKSLIGITGSGGGLMTFKQFKSYLQKSKFEKDNDVDVPGLVQILWNNSADKSDAQAINR